jgi:hypothetical protein
MELKERLHIGKVLIEMLEVGTRKLTDPYDDELPVFIKRAVMIQLRMKRFYHTHNQPPELLEQLDTIEKIVKRMTELQNSKFGGKKG